MHLVWIWQYKKNIISIVGFAVATVAAYFVYLYFYSHITADELTAFGSFIQWAASLSYIAYFLLLVGTVSAVIILILKLILHFIGFDRAVEY